MLKTEFESGGYSLTADVSKDLVVHDKKGEVIARTKEVQIPAAGTLNKWIEVVEELPKPANEDLIKEARIAKLKAELAQLETI